MNNGWTIEKSVNKEIIHTWIIPTKDFQIQMVILNKLNKLREFENSKLLY